MPSAAFSLRGPSSIFQARMWGYALFFCFCLVPIVVGIESVNYAYLLVPLPVLICTGKLRKPHENVLFAITIYMLIFVLAMVYQYELFSEVVRRAMSFVIFMSMFTFTFVEVDNAMVAGFKLSIIIMACYFSLYTMINFFLLGGSSIGFRAKDLVGSQRYGFIYLQAFWLLYLSRPDRALLRHARVPLIFVTLVGMALTFSRASIVALMVSYLGFTLWSLRVRKDINVGKIVKSLIILMIGLAVAIALISIYFPVILDFFNERLFQLFLSGKVENNLADSQTSEGERIFIWTNIIQFVLQNPLTGGGFLGFWILNIFGSAHNQYFDVLFRTGFVGLLIYFAFLWHIGLYLWRNEKPLFWGFFGVIAYGMFHETFKESQGGFALAFLMGMAWRDQRALPDISRGGKLVPVSVERQPQG